MDDIVLLRNPIDEFFPLIDEVREYLKEMLELGAIREPQSSVSSNVMLVRKNKQTNFFQALNTFLK